MVTTHRNIDTAIYGINGTGIAACTNVAAHRVVRVDRCHRLSKQGKPLSMSGRSRLPVRSQMDVWRVPQVVDVPVGSALPTANPTANGLPQPLPAESFAVDAGWAVPAAAWATLVINRATSA